MTLKNFTKVNYLVLSSAAVSIFYSVLRYNVFKGVPWSELPLYVFNKAVSLTAIVLIVLYQLMRNRLENGQKNLLKDYAVVLTISHVVISVVILSPEYYEKFYSASKLNLIGNLSILFGILAFIVMFIFSSKYFFRNYLKSRSIFNFLWFGFMGLLMIHVLVMGIEGWFLFESWPGGLPPITLLSFILLVIGFTARFAKK